MAPARQDVTFPSKGETIAAWLYPAGGEERGPAIILGHGLGAVKEMGLDRPASRFQAAGYTCLVFDYRHFGGSTGMPRQLLDPGRQLEDWSAAIDYITSLPNVDPNRVGVWGSSFGGGHAISIAARESGRVRAAVAQCPFTNGLSSTFTVGLLPLLGITLLSIRDLIASVASSDIVPVPLAAKPGQVALMNAPDVWEGYLNLVPEDKRDSFPNYVAARLALTFPLLAPGRNAKKVKCPILFAVCGKDTVAPAAKTLKYAKQAPKGVIKHYEEMGHFSIYTGNHFEKAARDYVAFFDQHLKEPAPTAKL